MVRVRNVWFLEFQNIPWLPHHQPCSAVLHLPVRFLWPFSQLYVLPFCQWDVIVCCFSIGNAFSQPLRLQLSAKLRLWGDVAQILSSLNPSLGSPPLIQREGMKSLLKPRIFLFFSVQCTCTQNRRRVAETLIAEFFNLSNPFHPDVDLYDFEQNTLC